MITRNALGAIALATTCLAPLAAFAQPAAPAAGAPAEGPAIAIGGTPVTGDIQIGVAGVMGTNPNQAGRYSGLNTTGVDLLGQFNLNIRDPWDSGGTRYYQLNGNNLVFQTGNTLGSGIGSDSAWASSTSNSLINAGSLGLKAGDQGTWEAGAYFNSITYTGNVIDSLYTVSGSQAFLNNPLGLSPTWGGASAAVKGPITSFTIPSLTATDAMQAVQVGTRRNIVGGDFKYIWGDWTFSGAFRHEHKEGSMEESFAGAYGGAAFALPIDYDTDRYDATAAYTTRLFQGSLQYTFSHFTDNNLFVNLPYPYSGSVVPFQQSAAYSTPPSSAAHYITVMLATDIVPLTRINLNARVGLEKQDDTFAPNTADPAGLNLFGANLVGLNSALQGTTANSPNITATVYQVKVSATSHPIANTDARAWYGIDGRNVNLDQYQVFIGGHGGYGVDGTPGGATNYAFVVPQDWTKQNAGAEVGYRILPESDTKVTVGYRFDAVDRSNAQVGHSSTNAASIALTSQIGPDANGKLSFEYANRTGALNYLGPWSWLGQGSTYSGVYYQAPMTSESVMFSADYMPLPGLSGDVFLQFKNENYNYPAATVANGGTISTLPLSGVGQGIKQDYALSLGPDINWRPRENVNLHFFYTYERLFYNNTGNGACALSNTGSCAGSVYSFQNKDTTSTHTVGVSSDWKVTDKLKLRGEYTFSYGSVMFADFNGVFVSTTTPASYQNVTNYPDINSTMHNLKLTATYKLTPSIDLVGQGVYMYFHNNDWNDTANAIQGSGGTSISILTPGYSAPNYSVGMLLAGVRFKLTPPPPPPPLPVAAPAPAAARSYLVFFDWDKATLTDRARQIVKNAADNSTKVQYTRIEVNGYTDTSGTAKYNQGLSVRRAQAVAAELVKDGVPGNAISIKGFGETHLLVPTGPGVREPQNRRVEIVII